MLGAGCEFSVVLQLCREGGSEQQSSLPDEDSPNAQLAPSLVAPLSLHHQRAVLQFGADKHKEENQQNKMLSFLEFSECFLVARPTGSLGREDDYGIHIKTFWTLRHSV